MEDHFDFSIKDLKHYPHFDAPIPINKIRELVTDKKRVAQEGFYPLFLYHEEWQPYRGVDGAKPEKKSRPIRYGARRDAYIFAHYRAILSARYEKRLKDLGIEECPIAYRKIEKPGNKGGKCNIDFAKDAFDTIDHIGNCVAIALDIKGYFENLDHSRIKSLWCDLLETENLPEDHYAVFKNITRYHYVDQREVYRRLGFYGPVERDGYTFESFTVPYKKIPQKICSSKEFRKKICGQSPEHSNLVQANDQPYGIPQGAPISDLIANFYLLDFDVSMNSFATQRGGKYMRYSDDILLILPGGLPQAEEAIAFAKNEVSRNGKELQLKDEKTCAVSYEMKAGRLYHRHLFGPQGKNGLEYLGFRYDGRKVYVRESTISRLYRKVSVAAKAAAKRHVHEQPDNDAAFLTSQFNYSLFSQRFARVKKENFTDNYKSWTFYTYLKRASKIFGSKGSNILTQSRNFDSIMRARVEKAIYKAVIKRDATE